MSYRTDGGGLAFKCGDAKLQCGGSSWATKLSQLGRQKGCLRIITYSLPDIDFIKKVFKKRPENIFIIANPKARSVIRRAVAIKEEFPNIMIAFNRKIHSKVVLMEPSTVMVSSANFGNSGWHETTVSFRSKEAHDHYVENEFDRLWDISDEVNKKKTPEEEEICDLIQSLRSDGLSLRRIYTELEIRRTFRAKDVQEVSR